MIDYSKIAHSVQFYKNKGFQVIEAPWWVSLDTIKITMPKDVPSDTFFINSNKKCLIGSGEQGFLYIAAKGRLPKGSYQTVTPCFRDDSIGTLHRKCFIKNELIDTKDVNEARLHDIINEALDYFKYYTGDHHRLLKVVKTPQETSYVNYDIEYDGIELGSYGIRSCSYLDWIYATGCAEPRLSHALDLVNFKRKVR